MTLSRDRILTTHAGSLPRPDDLTKLMFDKLDGKPIDEARTAARIKEAVAEVVQQQFTAGVDIVSDGEMSKPGFSNYVIQRFSGFGEPAVFQAADLADFPDIVTRIFANEAGAHLKLPWVEGPLAVKDHQAIATDLANLKAALGSHGLDEAFVSSVTPGQMIFNFPNKYYPSRDAYLEAAANVLREEYLAITDAGFTLQLDSPDLAMNAHCFADDKGPTDPHAWVPQAIEVLNHATRGIPPEKIRLHLCWGNYPGPHHHDVELKEIIAPVLKSTARYIYFEAANPRHAHEWEVWQEVRIPEDKVLIPGCIDTLTNSVEHPRLVAQRIERFAGIVGRERVMAGTDCGFSTFVGWPPCDPKVAWLKLEALAQGARIASDKLWKRAA